MRMVEQGSKYNIAWFKLAEFVWRGEREKAHAIFKLLSHSFQDAALTYQLEGDIHLSFKDNQKATQSYLKAADLYEKNGNFYQAASLFEHLFLLDSDSLAFALKRFALYAQMGSAEHMHRAVLAICALVITQKKISQIHQIADEFQLSLNARSYLYTNLLFVLLEHSKESHEVVFLLNQTLDQLIQDDSTLSSFLAKLQALDQELYQSAKAYLNSGIDITL